MHLSFPHVIPHLDVEQHHSLSLSPSYLHSIWGSYRNHEPLSEVGDGLDRDEQTKIKGSLLSPLLLVIFASDSTYILLACMWHLTTLPPVQGLVLS